jgi:hypothetical protein
VNGEDWASNADTIAPLFMVKVKDDTYWVDREKLE